MSREKRVELIKTMEEERNSSLICYITGDRENLSTRVAPDIIRVFYRHLENIGSAEKIDLFLYTRGGDVLTPWRLVNLIREYTPCLSVIIPFRAYSAGTLICLGADEIVMAKMGELGPIDPSVANAFNPDDPNNPQAKVPVSVEDVVSYLGLAQERAGQKDPQLLAQVFSRLTEKVHPLALGNVHRNYSLIRFLARRLLALHFDSQEEREKRIPEIIDYLTERLYAHNYMIPRKEAREQIKLNVVYPAPRLESIIWQLYCEYEKELKLLEPFDAGALLQGHGPEVDFKVYGGIIETFNHLDAFIFQGRITQKRTSKGAGGINMDITYQGWNHII